MKQHAPAEFVLIVCGTKADLDNIREVSRVDAQTWCQQHATDYFEVSNKTGDGVDDMFTALSLQIYNKEVVSKRRKSSVKS